MLDWRSDSVTYRGQGSYRFTPEQRGALILACDIEIISVVRQPYESLKSVPSNSHYGFAVVFYGSTPIKRVDLEFPATRVFHETNLLGFNAVQNELLARRFAEGIKTHYNCMLIGTKFCSELDIQDPPGVTLPGMPETVVKVKVPEGSQFGIVARWLAIPEAEFTNLEFEASDGSDGLDEFGKPKTNDPGSPFAGNPPESGQNPLSDPRDFRELTSGDRIRITYAGRGYPTGSPSVTTDIGGSIDLNFEGDLNGYSIGPIGSTTQWSGAVGTPTPTGLQIRTPLGNVVEVVPNTSVIVPGSWSIIDVVVL